MKAIIEMYRSYLVWLWNSRRPAFHCQRVTSDEKLLVRFSDDDQNLKTAKIDKR